MRLLPTMRVLVALACAAPTPVAATTFRALLADSARETDPTPSPDGKWLAYASHRGGEREVWLLPLDGGIPRRLTSEPDSTSPDSASGITRSHTSAGWPSWSADSKSLVYVSTRTGRYSLYRIPIDGGEAERLTTASGNNRAPAVSPDGSRIAFSSNRLQPRALFGFNLYMMDSAGETEKRPARQITHIDGSPGHPVWAPDGKSIAFHAKAFDTTRTVTIGPGMQTKESALFSSWRIFTMDIERGEPTQLTGLRQDKERTEETWPTWSPDGKWIAYGRQTGAKRDIWLCELATGTRFPLTRSGNCAKPAWSPDGMRIYYTIADGGNEDIWVAEDLTLEPPKEPAPAKKDAKKAGSKR